MANEKVEQFDTISAVRLNLNLLILMFVNVFLIVKTGSALFDEMSVGLMVILMCFEVLFLSALVFSGYYFCINKNYFIVRNQWLPWVQRKFELDHVKKITLTYGSGAGAVLVISFDNGKKSSYVCSQIPLKRFRPLRDHLSKTGIEFHSSYKLD